MIFTGDFDEGERWLQRAAPALEADAGPSIRLLAHIVSGMLQVGRRLHEAVKELEAA
jgi:LuxR family transcriptional regulator, maltose regulon positive regulatory protein